MFSSSNQIVVVCCVCSIVEFGDFMLMIVYLYLTFLTIGEWRVFPMVSSHLWNSLSCNVTSAPSLELFQKHLKTHQFCRPLPVRGECPIHIRRVTECMVLKVFAPVRSHLVGEFFANDCAILYRSTSVHWLLADRINFRGIVNYCQLMNGLRFYFFSS